MKDIRPLNAQDAPDVVELWMAAFQDDPGTRFVYQSTSWANFWQRRIYSVVVRAALRYGNGCGIDLSDGDAKLAAAAVWLPSDASDSVPMRILNTWRLFISITPLMFVNPNAHDRLCRLRRLHYPFPADREPYLYLSGIAVSRECRRRGMARRLIERVQEEAAGERRGVFLHCWNYLVPYYERLGFVPYSQGKLREMGVRLYGMLWTP